MDARLFLELNEAKTENLKFPQCLGAHLTGQRPVGAFAPYKRFDAGKTSADCARRRVSERNRRLRRLLARRWAIHLPRALNFSRFSKRRT